jgi:hypothetical protein
MLTRLAAVGKDFGILATGFFEGISEDRKTSCVERHFCHFAVLVDAFSEVSYRAIVPMAPNIPKIDCPIRAM